MRELHLYPDRQRGVLVDSLTSAAALTRILGFQNDTLKLFVHGGLTKRPPESLSTAPYIEQPWSFNALRASISAITATGSVDVAPERGTFKLRVEDQTTGAIEWPEPADPAAGLTAAEIATFKAAVLAALQGLSNVEANDIEAADPLGAPVHTLYFAWTDPTDEREIEIIDAHLQPPVEAEVGVVQASPFVQFVKLVQLPIVFADEFEFPNAPVATIASERAGGAGVNEVQRLTIPEDGAFDLTWEGARTAVLSCAGLTAATIASALNAIVTSGASNPSFAVLERSPRVFAVEFIGPLANADQALLVATMRQTASSLVAVAPLPLTSRRFERALNGAQEVKLRFELVIDSEENTFQVDFLIQNDATGPGTAQSIEEQNAVLVRTETIYIDESGLEPIATVAAGVSASAPSAVAAGVALSVPHGKNTWDPDVRVFRRLVDHVAFALDPSDVDAATEGSVPLGPGEFGSEATTVNDVEITFATALVDDPASEWDYRLIKLYIYSPNSTVELLAHPHPISDITGLQALLDALAAAIGMFGANLKIPASSIDGKVAATQIDIDSFIDAINTAISNNATTAETWYNMIRGALETPGTIERLVELLGLSPAMTDLIRRLLLAALASLQATGASITINGIPSVTLVYPPSHTIEGPTVKTTVPAAIEKTEGGVKTTYTGTQEIETNRSLIDYAPLSPAGDWAQGSDLIADIVLKPNSTVAVGTFTADGTANTLTINAGVHGLVAGDRVRVPENLGSLVAGTDYYVIATDLTATVLKVSATPGGAAFDLTGADANHTLNHFIADCGRVFEIGEGVDVKIAASDEGIDSSHPVAGEYVTFQNGHWFTVRKVGDTWYPTRYEWTLGPVMMSGDLLTAGKRWSLVFAPTNHLASLGNDVVGRGRYIIESAVLDDVEGSPLLDELTWTERLSLRCFPCASPGLVRGSAAVECRTVELDTCTVNAGTDVITVANAHGLSVGDRVRFTSDDTLPAGLVAGRSYYVKTAPSGTTLTLSETLGGATVDITDTGDGEHTIYQDAFSASATLGGVTAEWTPASGFLALRVRFVEFDPGPAPNGEPFALAGTLTVAGEGATHSLVALT